ncbi:MAG: biotin/lipoyl-binding protein [Firmicutes bacterium]|nr:biotin/lipoyl-binding protein [Bacillota bacterium]
MEKYIVRINGKEYEVEVEKVGGAADAPVVEAPKAAAPAPAPQAEQPKAAPKGDVSGNVLEAGAAGKVFRILKKAGDKITKGETVIILEAMKMEIPMVSPWEGTLAEVLVNEGQPVEAGDRLAIIQ